MSQRLVVVSVALLMNDQGAGWLPSDYVTNAQALITVGSSAQLINASLKGAELYDGYTQSNASGIGNPAQP